MSGVVPRILFVIPPVRLNLQELDYLVHWPRAALVIAAELGAAYQVEILDLTAEFICQVSPAPQVKSISTLEETFRGLLRARLDTFRPDLVAIHAHAAPHVPVVASVLTALATLEDTTPIVLGGMAASHLTSVLAKLLPLGATIVRGEATGRCRETFDAILGKADLAPKLGTASLDPRGIRILSIGRSDAVIDYPLPDFERLPMDVYRQLFEDGQFVPHLELTSGCTFHCTFCGVHYPGASGSYRRRPLVNVMEELTLLRERYGFDEFYFCDEFFTLDRELVLALCARMTETLPGIRWRCVTRVDAMDDELAARMAQAGCYEIGFGVEAGSEPILKRIAKRASVNQGCATIELVQRHGIRANALTVIGLPDEDHADIRRTFEFLAREARPQSSQIFVFHPVPGTMYFEQPERFGLNLNVPDLTSWYRWDHIGEPVCDTRYLSREQIARYYLLFNRALPTIADPEPDEHLIQYIIDHRFPVVRKGITWFFDGSNLQIYCPKDPSNSIEGNTLRLQCSKNDSSDVHLNQPEIVETILTRANGNRSREDIAHDVAALFNLDPQAASSLSAQILSMLTTSGIVAEF